MGEWPESNEDVECGETSSWGPLASTLDEEPDDVELPISRFERGHLSFAERYDVKGVVSKGGTAEVRLAWDRPFARRVAMKALRPGQGGRARRWRFFREARVQGQLTHPAVVPVHDLGLDPKGALYFTMKWIEGVRFDAALRALRDPGESTIRLSPAQLLRGLASICRALDHAHGRGAVHRDIKPTNLMLGPFGEAYVLDWGLTKLRSETTKDPIEDATEASKTAGGSVLGTIGYLAPEQLRAETDVDARADIYSLGALLFEILTHRPLHVGSIPERIVSALELDGARPAANGGSSIPEDLDEICHAATRNHAADRLGSAAELAAVIEKHWCD